MATNYIIICVSFCELCALGPRFTNILADKISLAYDDSQKSNEWVTVLVSSLCMLNRETPRKVKEHFYFLASGMQGSRELCLPSIDVECVLSVYPAGGQTRDCSVSVRSLRLSCRLLLAHRLRRSANISPVLGYRVVFDSTLNVGQVHSWRANINPAYDRPSRHEAFGVGPQSAALDRWVDVYLVLL